MVASVSPGMEKAAPKDGPQPFRIRLSLARSHGHGHEPGHQRAYGDERRDVDGEGRRYEEQAPQLHPGRFIRPPI